MNDNATMNPEWKAKWLAALRGGRYAQSRQYLRTQLGYCCLGVLCDLVDPQGWSPPRSLDGNDGIFEHGPRGGRGYPGAEVMGTVGLSEFTVRTLGYMNDKGESFAMIADAIERDL